MSMARLPGRCALLEALPDNGRVGLKTGKGKPVVVAPARVDIPENLLGTTGTKLQNIWLETTNLRRCPFDRAVNLLADADVYEKTLTDLKDAKVWNRIPIFNRPAGILTTRRDRCAKLLEGCDNLIVPKCRYFIPQHPRDFEEVFRDGGFQYPVIVRVAGLHGGQQTVRVDDPDDWQKIHELHWNGEASYMIQFVDFVSDVGDYTKVRLVVIGGEFTVRHAHFGDDWNVHYTSQRTPEKLAREVPIFGGLEASLRVGAMVREVYQRLQLDYFAIDVGFTGLDDPLVFFEANPSMMLFIPPDRIRRANIDPEVLKKMKRIRDRMESHLGGLLGDPHRWWSEVLRERDSGQK